MILSRTDKASVFSPGRPPLATCLLILLAGNSVAQLPFLSAQSAVEKQLPTAGVDPHLARLRSTALQADTRSQVEAAKLRSSIQGDAQVDQARSKLKPLVVDAFRAQQQLHQAELESMLQRVQHLKHLVTARQRAERQIIDRRVAELLDPNLQWNAADPAESLKRPPPQLRAVSSSRTRNFFVERDPFASSSVDAKLLQTIAQDAESFYAELTREWFDQKPIPLAQPCGIDVTVQTSGGSKSSTSYRFTSDGQVADAQIHLQASTNQLRDVLRHEVMHLVLATQFKTPLPRWIDEGISSLQEGESAAKRMNERVVQGHQTGELIPLQEMFQMKSYPVEPKRVALLYAQAVSVVDWLIKRDGK
ncbi:MAG: hypothetical protein MI861_01620, partial [Pirellulales bacterium]|nr:hypothetical protein [Pirellulales bacterium]